MKNKVTSDLFIRKYFTNIWIEHSKYILIILFARFIFTRCVLQYFLNEGFEKIRSLAGTNYPLCKGDLYIKY